MRQHQMRVRVRIGNVVVCAFLGCRGGAYDGRAVRSDGLKEAEG
jgi:hypothetical protein